MIAELENRLILYGFIYILLVLASYFFRPKMPTWWNNLISNPRVKGQFCDKLDPSSEKNMYEWSSCVACDPGCSCANCPINGIKWLWQRALIPFYILTFYFIVTLFVPELAELLEASEFLYKLIKFLFALSVAAATIVPLLRLPTKLQYRFKGTDANGFNNIKADGDGPFICGDADKIKGHVLNDPKAKDYFATDCSINSGKLLLNILWPILFIIIVDILGYLVTRGRDEDTRKKVMGHASGFISKLTKKKVNVDK